MMIRETEAIYGVQKRFSGSGCISKILYCVVGSFSLSTEKKFLIYQGLCARILMAITPYRIYIL